MQAQPIRYPLPEEIDDTWLDAAIRIDSLADQYQQTYRYIRRHARPAGFARHDMALIKLYHMERERTALPADLVSGFSDFVVSQLASGGIRATQGCGFAILSQGFVSINLWGRGNVLFTTTYTVEDTDPELSAKPLARTGVACTWEIRLMQHEYEAWHRYLETAQTTTDKRNYLTSFMSGPLY
jgi:hypothetical protein